MVNWSLKVSYLSMTAGSCSRVVRRLPLSPLSAWSRLLSAASALLSSD